MILLSPIIATCAFALALYTFHIQRKFAGSQRANKLYDRLYELDKIIISNPKIEKWIYDNESSQSRRSFDNVDKDEMFFSALGYIYFYLNLFEEVVATAYGDKTTETQIQFSSWQIYILKTLKRPFFWEVFKGEDSGCWMNLQRFLDDHKAALTSDGASVSPNPNSPAKSISGSASLLSHRP